MSISSAYCLFVYLPWKNISEFFAHLILNVNLNFGLPCSMQKFPGQGWNLCHSSDPSCSSDNTTRDFLFFTFLMVSFEAQKFLNFFFFSFSFLASLWHTEFLSRESNLSHSCDHRCSCSYTRYFNSLCWAGDWTWVLALRDATDPIAQQWELPKVFNFDEVWFLYFFLLLLVLLLSYPRILCQIKVTTF